MKCEQCNREITPGLHICTDGALVWYAFENFLPDMMGECSYCGMKSALRDTLVSPDYATPRCPLCAHEWRASSSTDRV